MARKASSKRNKGTSQAPPRNKGKARREAKAKAARTNSTTPLVQDTPAVPATMAPAVFVVCLILLLVATITSGIMVWEHYSVETLPGCGPQSGCAKAVNSIWGSVPGLDWPTSFLGFAFFLGLLICLIVSRGTLGGAARWLARLGALGSLGFIIIMIAGGYICPYCLTIHVANLVFIALLETTLPARRVVTWPRPALASLLIAFAAVNLVLLPIELIHRSTQAREQQVKQEEDIRDIIEQGNDDEANDPRDMVPENHPFADRPFIGRYPRGPEAAPIRIVMFTGYQCPDCKIYETQLERIIAQRTDVQVSIMHFPFSTVCNEHVGSNRHPNACWAARAAEAAGIIGGVDAFWRMHFALFERQGSFTNDNIRQLVSEVGLDFPTFLRTMQSQETLNRVKQDIEAATALGLTFTPMIFINGKQVRIFGTGQDLAGAVRAIAAANLPARTAENDLPVLAVEKYIGDWQEARPVNLPASDRPWASPDPEAPLRITVFGDYDHDITAELNQLLQDRLAGRDDVSFTWRHYPFNTQCNEHVDSTRNEQACEAARAAEAAGRLGGEDAYWAMHDWLLARHGQLPEDFAPRAAADIGLNVEQFNLIMQQPALDTIIQSDVALGRLARVRGVPTLFINERRLGRWRLDDDSHDMIQAVIDRALEGQ